MGSAGAWHSRVRCRLRAEEKAHDRSFPETFSQDQRRRRRDGGSQRRFRGSYILLGGLNAWRDEVLFPTAPADVSAIERAEFDRVIAVSTYFGGSPQDGADTGRGLESIRMPKIEAPTTPLVQAKRKRKAKEGCWTPATLVPDR
jgi:hypothetical protein